MSIQRTSFTLGIISGPSIGIHIHTQQNERKEPYAHFIVNWDSERILTLSIIIPIIHNSSVTCIVQTWWYVKSPKVAVHLSTLDHPGGALLVENGPEHYQRSEQTHKREKLSSSCLHR